MGSRLRSRRAQLALVALCYGIVQLIAVSPGMGLGWDEVVHVSQVDPRVPATEFTTPRAPGITLLVAPVVFVTSSTAVLRVYLCVLSAVALYASFGTWLGVRRSAVVPVAALLFASTWVALFYGNAVTPNPWVAFCAVAAVGCFLRCVRPDGEGGGRGAAAGLALSVAAVTLLRPQDSLWLVLPLALALARPGWRCARAGIALAAGLAVGWIHWIVEAYVRFGGPAARWHASATTYGTGPHFSLLEHVRALGGPPPCRPPADCGQLMTPWLPWLIAIPVLVLLGLYAARRRDRLPECALPAACGLAMALPYAFLVGHAAPRSLLPAYALLALPVAHAVTWAPSGSRGRRRAAAGLVGAGFLAQFVLQGVTLDKVVADRLPRREIDVLVAKALRARGVLPPCVVYGEHAVTIAYRMGCRSHPVLRWPGTEPAEVGGARGAGAHVVAVKRGRRVPAPFLRMWEKDRLIGQWHFYVPRGAFSPPPES